MKLHAQVNESTYWLTPTSHCHHEAIIAKVKRQNELEAKIPCYSRQKPSVSKNHNKATALAVNRSCFGTGKESNPVTASQLSIQESKPNPPSGYRMAQHQMQIQQNNRPMTEVYNLSDLSVFETPVQYARSSTAGFESEARIPQSPEHTVIYFACKQESFALRRDYKQFSRKLKKLYGLTILQ